MLSYVYLQLENCPAVRTNPTILYSKTLPSQLAKSFYSSRRKLLPLGSATSGIHRHHSVFHVRATVDLEIVAVNGAGRAPKELFFGVETCCQATVNW